MPVPPAETMATIAANATALASWRSCEIHTRSTFNILSLCISTLVISVWNAVHHDVPYPETPRCRVYLMRFYGFLVGLFLPEVLVLNALHEFMKARKLLEEMSGIDPGSPFTISYWKKLLREIYPPALTISYWTEAWRPHILEQPERPEWSLGYAFYAGMGGFVARSNSGRFTVLSPTEIRHVCKSETSMRPLLAEDGIYDHSGTGTLAKALFCWQLLVFAISCVARLAEHLSMSLLEITTLAHALCGLTAFALWWHKPHSVGDVVVVPVDASLEDEIDWGKPHVPDGAALGGMGIILYKPGDSVLKAVLSSLAVAVIYGLPHLLALRSEFPSHMEKRAWEIATAAMVGSPLTLVAFGLFFNSAPELFGDTLGIRLMGLFILYCLASAFIVAGSVRQLFALPSGAFLAPAFVCYLPHFS